MSEKKCAVCERPLVTNEYAPFCSQRCADVDLSRWLKGGYVIPGGASDSAEDNAPGPEQREDEI